MKDLQQEAIDFVYVVKRRFTNQPSKFNEFAQVLASLKLQQDHTRLISKLNSLFADDHPDLLHALQLFLPNTSEFSAANNNENDDDDDHVIRDEDHPPSKRLCTADKSWFLCESSSELFDRIRDRCVEKNDVAFRVLIEFTESVLAYYEKRISYCQVDQICKDLFRDDPDLFIESNRVISQSVKKCDEKKRLGLWGNSEKDKLGEKYESLSNGEKKDKSSDKGYNSLYEATMDVKEFYLFEMDLAFSRVDSTIEKLEKNVDNLEECLTVLDFKCIRKLYNDFDDDRDGGFGEAMVEILKSDSVARVQGRVVVLQRLRQKKMQLEEQKLRLDKIWNEIFEDIMKQGRVCRHREFLRRTKEASINGYKSRSNQV
ncbi:hypothetical protein DCAR_0103225 [Daucus carota subsp. sativus]|uniref:Uncharacterized protein n=1 Tax=Daucus carota subsp. sativus TaxID=79200 RepID=A0A166HUC4_DAUCS|nr:hypothetical protein DCAR_0103225 [Daucus carota subsp. sativus]